MRKFIYTRPKKAFSLVEVLLAISVVAIAMVPLIGLIPMGIKQARASVEETHASHFLTAVIQDLRYTHATETKSESFNISPLPFSGEAKTGILYKRWIDPCWNVFPENKKPKNIVLELEWEYKKIPPSETFLPVEATFTVKWPPRPNPQDNAAEPSKKGGEISIMTAFPKPQN